MSNEKEGILMQQEEKHRFVPKLRFPEFRDADAWKFVPLNKQAKRCAQKNRDGVITRVLTNSAEYGVVDQRDYFDKDIATQGNLESYYVVKKGDYVYNPRISASAPVGPISKNNVATGVMSPLYSVFRFGDSNNDFYAYYFKTAGWHQYMRQASSTGARHDRMAITNDDFMAMPLPASTPEEQQKIADCLSSLDDLIRLEAEKLDAIKAHKKGLLHQLFPAEGETLPKLRFPEFREAKEWERMRLEEIATFHKGKGIAKADIDPNGENPCIRYGELYTTYSEIIDKTVSRTNLQSTELFLSCRNDVLIPSSGETKQDIAKASCVMVDDVALGGDLNIIRSTENGIFLSYLLNGSCSKEIARIAQGDTVVHLYASQLKLLAVAIPDLAEQQRIADCLGSLGDAIAMQARKVDALKTHKKGLMQQLFPTTDEVRE
jgi:type I restriction enzyme S subunit